jgi:N-acyl-D-aspartate/D-glutamate deacylase
MYDLLIRNGSVIDGTGAPARREDVAVVGNRIVAVGKATGSAHRVIDAEGLAVTPGFIDVHTHYDAQVFWDGSLSPSCYHGVTTVFGGNCGFSIAPLSTEAAPFLLTMLARVEGMPEASLRQGVPWDWTSFAQYLSRLEHKIGVNAGFMAGHSAIRRVVMGERASEVEASPEEIERMRALLSRCLAEGAMGFSTTVSNSHNDAAGRPVPSRYAARSEILELCRVCAGYEGTSVEVIPGINLFGEAECSLMSDMSVAANRPVNWNVLSVRPGNEGVVESQLSASDYARSHGGRVFALAAVQPTEMRINLHNGFVFDMLDGWAEMFRLPIAERMQLLGKQDVRQMLDRRAKSDASGSMGERIANWEKLLISNSRFKELEGKSVGEVAAQRGVPPIDAMFDTSMAEELRTTFVVPVSGLDEASWKRRADVWKDPRTVVGASDAGAHLDVLDTFAFTTRMLAAARKLNIISLEEAVRQLTSVPASLVGLRSRGMLREGWHADLVIFDPATIDSKTSAMRFDLPGEEMRLYADAVGIKHVIVNGVEIVHHGEHTGGRPGKLLRSGVDTANPSIA